MTTAAERKQAEFLEVARAYAQAHDEAVKDEQRYLKMRERVYAAKTERGRNNLMLKLDQLDDKTVVSRATREVAMYDLADAAAAHFKGKR